MAFWGREFHGSPMNVPGKDDEGLKLPCDCHETSGAPPWNFRGINVGVPSESQRLTCDFHGTALFPL